MLILYNFDIKRVAFMAKYRIVTNFYLLDVPRYSFFYKKKIPVSCRDHCIFVAMILKGMKNIYIFILFLGD